MSDPFAPAIADGKAVTLTYTITDAQGAVLERVDLPVTYVHGSGRLLPKVEAELAGHRAGDSVTVTVSPEEGFGTHRPELTFTDDLANVPEQFRFPGAEVEMVNASGAKRTFVVTVIENGKLTVDGNHPFAGKDLVYKVEILEVREATEQERAAQQGDG